MGVPVITLRGDRHAGRVGASLLTQIGLTDLIAHSIEEYVEIAVALAGNSGRLDDLRRALRPRMAASTMCDERCLRVQNGSCVSLHVAALVCTTPPPGGSSPHSVGVTDHNEEALGDSFRWSSE